MGFLKRFLSLGSSKSRKNKKKQNTSNARVDAEGRIVAERVRQDPDTSANRLLRSSSTKFSVMSAIDYTALPPLPASVNNFLNTPPMSPSPSLVTVATTSGLQRSGTYVVKVHGRTTHSKTEFPHANPPISPTKPRKKQSKAPKQLRPDDTTDGEGDDEPDGELRLKEVNFTPKDTSRMYNLRRDPSVASLLNLYDDHGCLDSNVFANSPPTPPPTSDAPEGRDPTRRTGSTFRQLLAGREPAFMNNTTEGDLSWAERFLEEQLGNDSPLSSPSSLELETPRDVLFPDTLSAPRVAAADTTLSSVDPDSSVNYPAISSMEVEVSGTEEDVPVFEAPPSKPLFPDPKTPQRASEVFGFLSRRNTLTIQERDLPPLPQVLTPETTGNEQHHDNLLHPHDTSFGENLDATHSANTSHSTQTTSSDTQSSTAHAQIQTATMTKLSTAFAASTTSLNLLLSHDLNASDTTAPIAMPDNGLSDEVILNHTGSTSAPAQAASHPTGSSLSNSNGTKAPPSKIPRGPRPRPLSVSRHDASTPAAQESDAPHDVVTQLGPTRQPDAPVPENQTPNDGARPSKREAFTNIPQRQHRRVTSRSSACSADVDALLRDEPTRRDSALLKLPVPSSSKSKSKSDAPSRKRSTKPEQLHTAYGKENTPSPPPSARASPGMPSAPTFAFTPVHARMLADIPPSPASSSELSPVAREMMSDLRQQRMRARQVERRRGIWVRE